MARKIISCSACGARFDVAKYPPGSRVRCGRCNQVLTVPEEEAAVAPVVAPSGPARPTTGGSRSNPSVVPAVAPSRSPAAAASARAPAPPPPAAAPSPPPATGDADPLVGRVIHNQYRIARKLGEGGYGAVYEAKDVQLERRVAIKIMLQARAQSREYVAKFLREARTAAQLSHPNVVAVHGVGFDRDLGVHFLAMEYVEGRTLHDILQERGPMPLEEACTFIVQSCRGLQAAHERAIIHRDIKPGNLMLTPGGVVKITDFGLAKVYDEGAAQSTVIGTPYFMPPEQFEGKAKDGRTDIYALGVTFYYMLTMQRPHTGNGPAQILLSVMTKDPPSVLEHRPDLPEGIWPIVRRMIARDLDKRYATCSEVIADLERFLGGGEEEVERVFCPGCGAPNELDATVCVSCAASLQEICPVCSAADAAGTKFCGECGANIPVERAVLLLLEEAQGHLQSGRLARAEEKLGQAQERSSQNLRVTQLLRDLEVRREQRDAHRDAVRDLLAQGRPDEALERWKIARAEFAESQEIADLEGDVNTALAARASSGSASADAVAAARALEEDGRIREALVAWRGVLVLLPGNDDALQGETRTRERVERADAMAADATEFLREGDPETALERLAEAVALVPKDPVIGGRHRETERSVQELRADLDAAEATLRAGPSQDAVERLRILAQRHPGARRVREALDRAETAGRAATEGAARDRFTRALTTAKKHEEAKHLRDAAAFYRTATDLDPDAGEASEGLARCQHGIAEAEALLGQSRSLVSSGDPEGAVAAAEQALALIADDPTGEAQLARARTTLETLRHEAERIRAARGIDLDDDVLTWARELATRFPGSPLAADVLRETEKACREAEEKAAESRAKTLLARARKLEEEKQFERAAAAYEEAVRAAPSNVEATNALTALRERLDTAAKKTDEAETALAAGDPDAAKACAEQASKLVPDQVRVAKVLAAARTALAEIDRASETFEQGARVPVERAEAQVERLRRLRARYAASKRCAELEERAAKVLDTARAAAHRGKMAARIAESEAALAEGRLADAERAARDAQTIEPSDAVVAGILAKVAERRAKAAGCLERAAEANAAGRVTDALRLFEEALAADPADAAALAGRDAASAAIEKQREQVRKAQGEAVQADRDGRARDAVAAWERVLELEPGHAKAQEEILRLRAWIVRAEDAMARVRRHIADGDPEAALAAAQDARAKLGAWSEADEALRQARALVDEVDKGVRKFERDLAATDGELTDVAAAARALAEKFRASTKARDAAARAEAAAEERRRSLAVSQVRRFVREHRYEQAVALAAELRAQGVVSSDLDGAEAQAKRVLADVARFREEADALRTRGDLEGAKTSLSQVIALLPEDAAAKEAVRDLEETLREFTARVDAAESARRRGEMTRALEIYREALGFNPGATTLRTKLDEVGEQTRRRSELIRTCEGALRAGDGETCARTAKDLLALFPDDDDARDLQTTGDAMGRMVASLLAHARRQRELGETDSARVTLECLLRIAPGHAEAQALLPS